MSLVMMVTLMPWGMFGPSTVEAADLVTIDYPSGVNDGKKPENAINVSDRLFTFTGSYASGQVSDLSYTITNLGSGYTSVGGTPETAGTNLYRFRNITLTPGVNEIMIKHSTGYNIPIYVRFNDMPTIYDLKINGKEMSGMEIVLNETIIPGRTLAGNLNGYAANATSVEITNESLIATNSNAKVAAQVFGATGMFSGSIPLKAGENTIVFVAKNETKSVTETRRVIVNAITAGAGLNVYNLQSHSNNIIKSVPRNEEIDFFSGTSNQPLYNQDSSAKPDSPGADDIQFTGRLIVNLGNNSYVDLDPSIDPYSDITFDIRDKSGTIITGGAVSLVTPAAIIFADNAAAETRTLYYDFKTPIFTGHKGKFQHGEKYTIVIDPTFLSSEGVKLNFEKLEYSFTYIDNTYPRIESFQNADNNELLYKGTNYRITQDKFNLRVNFDNLNNVSPGSIVVRHKAAPYDSKLHAPGAAVDKTITEPTISRNGDHISVVLDSLLPGNNLVEVYYKDSAGKEIYEQRIVLVTTAPLVTITDGPEAPRSEIVNDKIYEFKKGTTTGYTDASDYITKKFGNVTFDFAGVSDQNPLGGANNKVFISLNNKLIEANGFTTTTTSGGVTVTNGAIKKIDVNFTTIDGDLATTLEHTFRQGLNTIEVRFKNGNNDARVEINFYLFTESTPEIIDLEIYDPAKLDNKTTKIEGYKPYETESNKLTISGKIREADSFIVRIQGVEVAKFDLSQVMPITLNGIKVDTSGTDYKFTIEDYELENPSENVLQGTFEFAFEVKKDFTSMTFPMTITRKVEPYTVLAPYRSVVNNNFQKVIIRSDSAVSVTIGKEKAEKVTLGVVDNVMSEYITDWLEAHLYSDNQAMYDALGTNGQVFFAEVALKKGQNKIPITVDFGSQQVSGDIPVYYAASAQPGAVFKTDMIKSNKIKVADWGSSIELNFPKGTLLQKKDLNIYGEYADNEKYYEIPSFWVDKQILIGIADKETGKVDRDIKHSTSLDLQMSLNNTYYNSYFQYSSPLYFIDAGDLKHPGGRLPYEYPRIYDRTDDDALQTTQRGTITIAYDSSIVMDAGPHLAVMYNPGYGSIGSSIGWQNLGGTVNTKNNTITVPFEGFGYYTVMKLNRSLSDIIYHPWGRRNLETMFSKGIMISEPGTNRFGTDLNITRGEFVTMLVKALNIPINAGPYNRQGLVLMPVNSSFDDIRPGMGDYFWQHEYLETAARAGIIQGMQPGLFMPNEQLTREQAAVIIARATEAKLARTPEIAMTQLTKSFTDATSVEYYALQAVAAINQTGIVVGKQNDSNDVSRGFSFLPKNNLTRAEAATIAVRLMQKQKLLPDPL